MRGPQRLQRIIYIGSGSAPSRDGVQGSPGFVEGFTQQGLVCEEEFVGFTGVKDVGYSLELFL
jgi:hypothetical protein